VAALRRLELEVPDVPARRGMAIRPSPTLVRLVLDAVALAAAIVVVSGGRLALVATGLVAFAALNADTSRAFRLDPRVGPEVGWLLTRVAVPLFAFVALVSTDTVRFVAAPRDVPRIVVAGSVGALLVLAGRAVSYAFARAARARGLFSEATLLVGSGSVAIEIAEALDRHPEFGLRPIGFIDGPTTTELPLPLLGAPEDLARVVEEFGVGRLVIAFGNGRDRDTAILVRALEVVPVEVYVVPRFFELGSIPSGAADSVRGIPLVHLRRPAMRPLARAAKRAFDVTVAVTLLLVLAPVLLLAALAVRLSSPGPVLFRQTRVGRSGNMFQILKFRTMTVDDAARPSWTLEEHRITRVGRLLRRTSIDELPQLINVIRGDMSLVGPRPEVPHFVEQFTTSVPAYADRLRVQGGVTGLAQVHGRSRSLESIPERTRLDNAYIEGRSMWGDVLILLRTLEVLFRGDR
jgi:exopolysaccharide biosynthesis polyprenyl glycosylphosphotransferase